MYLTEKVEKQQPRNSDDHEEVELLLESFSKQIEEIVSEVETLSVSGPVSSFSRSSPRVFKGQCEEHRGHHRADP